MILLAKILSSWQITPDAGKSTFFYDKLGRIAASQNAKQQVGNKYSYTYYDILGRTVESGELQNTTLNQSIIDNYANWQMFLHNPSRLRNDITYSKYDKTFSAAVNNKFGSATGQQNLQGRVASILSFADNTSQTSGNYRHATHYTYDVSGNVPVVIQDYPNTPLGDKVIAYNFDLVSGKVNEVRYEPGMPDEFRHKYSYDDNLRVTNVYTSRRGVIWERDAEYFYYKHGPLARTELGQLKVQGIDYIYTLQGWIKGVNGTDEDVKQDAGRDGIALGSSTGPGYNSIHSTVAADAFGYVLNYFNGDYKPIANNVNTTTAMNTTMSGVKPLYNGNINRMYTYLQTLGGLGMNYEYDQLNRLKNQQAFTFSGITPIALNAYGMDLNYDGNGNILRLKRDGRDSNPKMDKLSYTYYDANNVEIPNMASPPANATNRLASVQDPISSGNYPESGTPLNGTVTDIDNQSANNYRYDAIGNLIKDNAEGILNINWNLQNKISEIDKTGSSLYFAYDALGNRVSKKYVNGNVTTEIFYVRDASGTVMGTYEKKQNKLFWKEQNLYGSSRLGMWQPNQLMAANPAWNGKVDWQNMQALTIVEDSLIRGSKQYELSNHLGNVLVTVSDRRIQTVSAASGTSGVTADLRTATDYYGFGMQMPGRNVVSASGYRYGFNGKENDNEVKGEGNQQDYGMRIYDPRLGRFLSVDPLTKTYPWYTPYQFAGNTPIMAIDLDGLEENAVIRWYDNNGKYSGSTMVEIPSSQRIQQNGTLIINLNKNDKPSGQVSATRYLNTVTNLLYYKDANGTRKVVGGKILEESKNSWERGALSRINSKDKVVEYKIDDREIKFEDPNNVETPTNPEVFEVFKNTLKDNPDFKLKIAGNASTNDNVSEDYNQKLSDKRAETVKNEILKGGGSESQIKVQGNGTRAPKTSNNDEKSRRENRRAVINTSVPKNNEYN